MGIEKPKESLKLNRNIPRFFFLGGEGLKTNKHSKGGVLILSETNNEAKVTG